MVVDPSGQVGDPGTPAVVLPAVVQPPQKRVLVIGDENLLFSAGLQEAHPDIEFTAATVLSRQLLEAYNFDPAPQVLRGRIRHMVDPCRIGNNLHGQSFDDILLFLPGLGFSVPRELGTADRPLFAYRTHLFVFHVIRHLKVALKSDGPSSLHLVWPDDARFMTSPCGAAGIEMQQLINFCGCKPVEAQFEMDKIRTDAFWPFVFGEVPAELPEWLSGTRIHSFSFDRSPISVPLSVALLLHPDVGLVTIKDASPDAPSGPNVTLRQALLHEAQTRKDRLKEIYGPKDDPEEKMDVFGLTPEPNDEDALLSIPMEIFMTSFDDIPHIAMLLKYQVIEEQGNHSTASLDVLDPRLPTRIARPPPPKPHPVLQAVNNMLPGRKRQRTFEEWAGMKLYCPLTKICTPSPEKMRLHLQSELYKRKVAETPGWDDSSEKKEMMADLEEEEANDERAKRMRDSHSGGKSEGKHGGKKGGGKGKGKGKGNGKGK